jgi:hypothetical protein
LIPERFVATLTTPQRRLPSGPTPANSRTLCSDYTAGLTTPLRRHPSGPTPANSRTLHSNYTATTHTTTFKSVLCDAMTTPTLAATTPSLTNANRGATPTLATRVRHGLTVNRNTAVLRSQVTRVWVRCPDSVPLHELRPVTTVQRFLAGMSAYPPPCPSLPILPLILTSSYLSRSPNFHIAQLDPRHQVGTTGRSGGPQLSTCLRKCTHDAR